jgi:hypothetical protein
MSPIEIPIATSVGKFVMLAYCLAIVTATTYWGAPKFKAFLASVVTRTIRPDHRILGFVVYACVFTPAIMAAYLGLAISTAVPTVISSQGVTGGGLACYRSISVVFPTCTFPLTSWVASRRAISWEDITHVRCMSRDDGSVRGFRIDAGSRRIEVGNLGNHDLSVALAVIQARAPRGTVQPCETPWD